MGINITWLGHSAFVIKTQEHTLLLDPFITGNPAAKVKPEELNPDFILISHGHGDHLGDTISIAQRTSALCIGMFDLTTWLEGKGLQRTHGMNYGGSHVFPFGKLKMTQAWHSSTMPDGASGGLPAGFIIHLNGMKIYFAGDTALFSDMQLIGAEGLDYAIIPVGDNFTMGPEDSIKAIHYLKPENVIPCHYNTFPVIDVDIKQWAIDVKSNTTSNPIILQSSISRQLT